MRECQPNSSAGGDVKSYTFTCVVGTDVIDTGPARDFASVDNARSEARTLLGKLATNALNSRDVDMVSVEIYAEDKIPIAELRLLFEEITK